MASLEAGTSGFQQTQARILHERFGERIPLEEILEVWKRTKPTGSPLAERLGDLKTLYRRRNWIAHGRYWPDRSGWAGADPQSLAMAVQEICRFAPDYPARFSS